MFQWFLILNLLGVIICDEKSWTVKIEQGEVKGVKYWGGDYYEFYGIPYATVPEGDDRFKGPLPPKKWDGIFNANEQNRYIMCTQLVAFDVDPIEEMTVGDQECLIANVFVHSSGKHSEKPLPVIVYIHGGAYSLGYASMVEYKNLLLHEVIVVSFNYRLGALGFLCLGTEDVPGNAGLRDQIELLKWVKHNIGNFNGDSNDITVAGFTVGASSVELLILSGAAEGLFNKAILDSGSALSPWAFDYQPIETAKHIAESLGYDGGYNVNALKKFYKEKSIKSLMSKSSHIWNTNSTFAFAPCVEKDIPNVKAIIRESPIKTLKEGSYTRIPLLTGFSNMEGISRLEKLDEWRKIMDDKFSKYLPASIKVPDEEKPKVIEKLKNFYFGEQSVTDSSIQNYVNYHSDAMFLPYVLRSARLHSLFDNPVYLYEFSYVGRLNAPHNYQHVIEGASHRDQTAYILNFGLAFTSSPTDLLMRQRLTKMWTNFAKQWKPITETDELLPVQWTPYSELHPNYLSINEELQLRSSPIEERYKLWEELLEKYPVEPNASHIVTNLKTEL